MQHTQDVLNYETFKEAWLKEILEGNPSSVQKGRSFARKLLTQWLDFDEENDEIIFCDGAGDGGIDIAYLQRKENIEENGADGNTWYLVQSKYGKAFAGVETLLFESQKLIDTLSGQRTNLSSISHELVEKLQAFISSASDKDKLILLFATNDPLTEAEERAIGDIKSIGTHRFGAIFDVDSINIKTIFLRQGEQEIEKPKIEVSISADLVQSGNELLVGSVKLTNIYKFLKDYQHITHDLDLIYEKNVRKFLGSGKKVNQGIADTISTKPERFGLYNNGITIVVENFTPQESGSFKLTNPYIVNGCQTTKTIWNELRKKIDNGSSGSSPELDDYKERLNKGIVVTKIVKVGEHGEGLLIDTTKYTNSQNSVTQKDFIALEKGFQFWAKEMAEKYNIYLEIHRGGWEAEKAKRQTTLDERTYRGWANAFDLLKIYGAGWLYEPGIAFGKNPPFAPGGSIFKRITESETFGVRDLYASYLLLKLARELNFGRGRDFPTRGQTKYLFCFTVINLLKDVMVYAQIPTTLGDLSDAIIKVFEETDSEPAKNLYNSALQVIDDYMTQGGENSLYSEPTFTGDSNVFLKDAKLGKSDDHSPKLQFLISMQKMLIRRPIGGVAMSKAITDKIKSTENHDI